ncbi:MULTISPECIES: acyl-CoA dehydrogenase family protein [unclassified Frankia]|uniref:acyl-CoA dehydrogenase family protein n=1 Tax=unclassified Frankia TaxID=2632575 RepID=UPI002AD54D00|nr:MULTISPECIES: acyl-CoA dehydrogenase family protein [unclassified Frankia]
MTLDGEAEQVRQLTRQVLADHAGSDEQAFLAALFDAGLAWVAHAPGDGGLGLRPKLQEVIDAELDTAGRRPDWLRNPIGIGMCAPVIATFGRPDQRRHLRPIWTAQEIWCQLFSEPGAGSDVAALATRAEPDGEHWIVNGQKVWTSLAHRARHGLLLARTDPDVPKHAGITAFLLDLASPGVEVRPLRQMDGNAHFNEVYLTDVRVPDANRLGEVGAGWKVAVATLLNERVSIGGVVPPRGSGPLAYAMAAWERASATEAGANAHTTIGAVRRDRLTRLWVEAEVLRLGNLRAQYLRERGTPGPQGSVLKLGSALFSQRVSDFAVELLGPEGMLYPGYEDPAETSNREDPRVRFLGYQSATIAGGTSEIMRNILAERVLGLPAEPRADRDVAWSSLPR